MLTRAVRFSHASPRWSTYNYYTDSAGDFARWGLSGGTHRGPGLPSPPYVWVNRVAPQPPDSARSPRSVLALLSANGDERGGLWSAFVEQHSRLIMHACRSVGSDHDAVMDRYAHVLQQLQDNDHERLRAYMPEGLGKFTTWLTVVVRRLSLDHHRNRYGRSRGKDPEALEERKAERKRLVDLVGERVDLDRLHDPSVPAPDVAIRRTQLSDALSDALARLDGRNRLVLAMRFEDDLSAREIAEVVGFPTPFHVYRLINKVLDTLRESLAGRGVEDAQP